MATRETITAIGYVPAFVVAPFGGEVTEFKIVARRRLVTVWFTQKGEPVMDAQEGRPHPPILHEWVAAEGDALRLSWPAVERLRIALSVVVFTAVAVALMWRR